MLTRILSLIIAATAVLAANHASAQTDTASAKKADTTAARSRVRPARAPRVPPPGIFTSLDSAMRMPDSVKYLNLRGQKIAKLPANMGLLKNLMSIDMGGCGLTSFPKEILACPQLATLNLNDNQIKVLPPEIDQLSKLTRLSLHNTGITGLPATIGKCQLLATLDLSQNPLVSLPVKELNTLPRLRSLTIGGFKEPEAAAKAPTR